MNDTSYLNLWHKLHICMYLISTETIFLELFNFSRTIEKSRNLKVKLFYQGLTKLIDTLK